MIDTVEKDGRLTRSRNCGEVLGVREAALSALLSILEIQVLEPDSNPGAFTFESPEQTAAAVKSLREYWKAFGGMPVEERMMKLLTNLKASREARREAAQNLARLGEGRTWAWWGFMDYVETPISRPKPGNAAVAKFGKPTVAEAILTAMDLDPSCEDNYLTSLVELGDKPHYQRAFPPFPDGDRRSHAAQVRRGLLVAGRSGTHQGVCRRGRKRLAEIAA